MYHQFWGLVVSSSYLRWFLAVPQQSSYLCARSVIFHWVSHDTHFSAVFIIVLWSSCLKPVALPSVLTGSWSAREGISLTGWARVGHALIFRPWLVVVSRWRRLFAVGDPQGTMRVLHVPPSEAVVSPLMLAVMVFLLFLCVYSRVSLFFTVYLCNAQMFTGLFVGYSS